MSRLLKWICIAIGGLIGATVIVILIAVVAIDTDDLKSVLEDKLEALTGRELTIRGPLRVHVDSALTVSASDVHLKNVSQGVRPDLLHVDRIEAQLRLSSLLSGTVYVERLLIHGPHLYLEVGPDSEANWIFRRRASKGLSLKWRLGEDAVSVSSAEIQFRDGKRDGNHRAVLSQFEVKNAASGSTVRVAAAGKIDGHSFSTTGVVTSSENAGAWDGRAAVDFALEVGDFAVTLKGTVDDVRSLSGIRLQIAADGKELATLAEKAGWQAPHIGAFRVSGVLNGSGRHLALEQVAFTAGTPATMILEGHGGVANVLQMSGVACAFRFSVTRSTWLQPWIGDAATALTPVRGEGRLVSIADGVVFESFTVTAKPAAFSGNARVDLREKRPRISGMARATRLDLNSLWWKPAPDGETIAPWSDEPFNTSAVRKIDADVDVIADRILLPRGKRLYRFSAHLRIDDGTITLAPIDVQLTPNADRLAGHFTAYADEDRDLVAAASIAAASIPGSTLATLFGGAAGIEGSPVSVVADLKTIGNSPWTLLMRLTGDVQVVIGPGIFPGDKIDIGASLLTRIFETAQPAGERRTELVCAAMRLPVKNGTITLDRNIAVRTASVSLVISGIIDLKTESMELYARTRATGGIGLESGKVTNMFKIHGAITAPSIGINPEGVVNSSLSVGAAFATGGLSLLVEGLTKQVDDSNPCDTALTLAVRR